MAVASVQAQTPLADAHIYYSHDAWDILPPAEAIKVLRKAGLRRAFVSSSSDRGTQMLYRLAPDLIVPVLRPYRRRGELGAWSRQWLADLPLDVAENIAYCIAETLACWALGSRRR